jgi:hypothetical protein
LLFAQLAEAEEQNNIFIMMADEGGDDDVFIYMGGDQEVPEGVTRAIVDPSVDTIRARAFYNCGQLVSIKIHDGVGTIEEEAFFQCYSLKRIELPGVRIIGAHAFEGCEVHGSALEEVEFGDKLDRIGDSAFFLCLSLRNIKIPKVRVIGQCAFWGCYQLTDVELSEDLERIENYAFYSCDDLRSIAIPLKRGMFCRDVFGECGDNLTQVDLVGRIHKSISSLHLERWRDEMNEEIGRINQVLPDTDSFYKDEAIKDWLVRASTRMEHYTSEHYKLLKDNMTQLELTLWKANLPSVDAASRHEARVTCGANIIIPHVLPFLNDHDVFPFLDYDLATLRDWINS